MQIAYFGLKGDGKTINQDALFDGTNTHQAKLCHTKTAPTPALPFCVAVADGVYHSPKAHLASRFWTKAIAQTDPNKVGTTAFFKQTFEKFCDEVGATAHGSATTLAGVVIGADGVRVFNVGDSAVFVIDKDGHWHKLSHDHTILNELLGEQADSTGYAQFYGGLMECLIADVDEYEFKVHRTTYNPKMGETVLVCTDGLTDEFTPQELTLMWQSQNTLTDKLAIMCQNLKKRQGHDDCSVVAVAF